MWLLLLAWAVLAFVTVLWVVPNEEDELTGRAESALQEAGIAAIVEFDGRDATLSGATAASEQARAIEVVRGVTGVRDAEWLDTVAEPATTTTIIPGTTTIPPGEGTTTSTPQTTTVVSGAESSLTGTLSRGALTLGGTVPSNQVALQVAGVADLVYGPFVTNDLVVDEAVAPAGWCRAPPTSWRFYPLSAKPS